MSEVTPVAAGVKAPTNMPFIVYICYLVGIIFPIAALVGLVIAYINKGDAPEWQKSHYQWQIRTFWIGFLLLIVSALTYLIVIGFFIGLFWLVWLVIRVVKGLKAVDAQQPIANPTSWLF